MHFAVLWDSQGFSRAKQYDHLFYGDKGYFLINLRDQGLSLLLTGNLMEKIRSNLQNFLIGNMTENAKFLTDQGNMYPT